LWKEANDAKSLDDAISKQEEKEGEETR